MMFLRSSDRWLNDLCSVAHVNVHERRNAQKVAFGLLSKDDSNRKTLHQRGVVGFLGRPRCAARFRVVTTWYGRLQPEAVALANLVAWGAPGVETLR